MTHLKLFNHYIRLPYVALSIIEFLGLMACAYLSLAYSAVGLEQEDFIPDNFTLKYALVYASIMLLATHAMGVYEAYLKEGFAGMLIRSIVSYCLLGALVLALIPVLIPDMAAAKGTLFVSVTLSLLFAILVRKMFFSLVSVAALQRKVLVLGAGQRAKALWDKVDTESLLGFEIVGFVSSDAAIVPLVDQKMLLDPSNGMKSLVDQYEIDEIIIATEERRRENGSYFPLNDLLHCKLTGTYITDVVEFLEREFSRIELAEINTSWMLFRNQFRHSVLRDKCKRVFDIVICLVLLFLVWPLMLLTAVAVYLETGAPIFYTQKRVGYLGKVFDIYKFRSMTQNAEKDGKAVWAKQNDARITRVGAFIRNTRLDELPQILNVLKGEMSFIGPRPERPEFVSSLSGQLPHYDVRHYVKPGLMGWAQLKYSYGASVEDAEQKLVYDLYYVKNHSILLDLLIVIQTVEIVLLGKGAQ